MFRFLQLIKREISKPLESFLKSIYQWYNNHHQNQNVPYVSYYHFFLEVRIKFILPNNRWFDIKLLQSSPCYPGRCIPILAFLFQYVFFFTFKKISKNSTKKKKKKPPSKSLDSSLSDKVF